MALPNYRYFIPATFAALVASAKPVQRRDLVEDAAKRFGVTEEQRREVIPSGRQLTYANRIGFALHALKSAGLAESAAVGMWRLSEAGRVLSARYPTGIPEEVAKDVDRSSRSADSKAQVAAEVKEDSDSPPEIDAANRAFEAIRENNLETAQLLLEEMRKLQPEQFELVALQVLQKAGYGHDSANFEHSGKSGDGGIDGWLPLDRLGLQKVYVQAKRYKESSTISASQVRDFAGAMLAVNARMGVFVTLSHFTNDARAGARNVTDRTIELMDGMKLAMLMIDVETGMSHQALPPLAKLDTDFFKDL